MKTLVVDDNIVNRVSMKNIMSELGQAEEAANGQEAIEAFRVHHEHTKSFDLVLLDIMMPGIDGIKVLKAIRDIERVNNIPTEERARVLMVTSHAHKNIVMAAMKTGCDGYIIKPFRRDVIIQKLKELEMIDR